MNLLRVATDHNNNTTTHHNTHQTRHRKHTTGTFPSPAHKDTHTNSFCVMRAIRHSTNGQRPVHSGVQASQTFAHREREPTERVNIVRELRKESCEEREREREERERARDKKKML